MKIRPKHIILFFLLHISSLLFSQNEKGYNRHKLEKMLHNINELNQEHFYELVNPLLKDKEQHITGLDYLARYFMEKEIPDSMIYYGNKMYELSILNEDSISNRNLSKSYNILGVAHGYKGLIKTRASYHLKGIKLHEKGLVDNSMSVHHIRGLADCFMDNGDYEKAIPLFEKSIAIDENIHTAYFSYNNLGLIYIKLKQYNKALEYLEKVKEAPDGHKVEGFRLINLSSCYSGMGDLDKAMDYALKAMKLYGEKNSNSKFSVEMENEIGKLYHKKNESDLAINTFQSALQKAKKNGFTDLQIEASKNLGTLLNEQGNYRSAFKYINNGFRLKDSILLIQKKKEINQYELQYEMLQNEKEISLLKKDQEIKSNEINLKNIIIVGSGLIIAIISLLLYTYYQKLKTQKNLNVSQKKVSNQKIDGLMKEQELKLIKASIIAQDKERKRVAQELHDTIGNNLSAIKLQFNTLSAPTAMANQIGKKIDETCNQIRELSHDLLPDKIRQNDFSEILTEYLKSIENATQISVNLSFYKVQLINKLKKAIQNHIFAIIQELTSNTIKHSGANRISIQVDLLPNGLFLFFEDNGKGFDTHAIKNHGIGLKNIKTRIEELSGNLTIDSRINHGTLVKIEIYKL